MGLKEYRIKLGIIVKEASEVINVPVRTYVRYENDENYRDILKRKQI